MTPGSNTGADLPFAIPKEKVAGWVERLQEAADVIAPVAGPGGDECFRTIRQAGEVLWDFVNPLDPPKRFLLPQTEPLARIEKKNGSFQVEALHDETPRVLLNVRSCDLKGLLYLRRMHAADLPDESLLRRFESFTLVSLACSTPCPSGFCVCCDAGPFLHEGFDLQLTDLGDAFLAEVGSEKGRRLVEAGDGLFRPATEEEVARRRELEEGALQSFGPETCHFGSAMRRISTRRVADTLWESMAPWCMECGGCTLACPTCYCFSVKDRAEAGWEDGDDAPAWTRCRIWDSCQYEAFTLEASGHNPREAKRERMKRRFHHKVSAQYYQKDGDLGCVGCGRCVLVCMGTTDMPSVVAAIRKGRWEGGHA
ncbi:MAG: 4Fe-4S dicluster domain-containing protein [Longimicrobiales bacterium]|nr:4Fe-4S dicluster domain-containing protein [Longimicrobiales bacterium]